MARGGDRPEMAAPVTTRRRAVATSIKAINHPRVVAWPSRERRGYRYIGEISKEISVNGGGWRPNNNKAWAIIASHRISFAQ